MSKPTKKFNVKIQHARLRPGDVWHVKSHGKTGRFLRSYRWGMNKWMKRLCKKNGWDFVEVWGNHDGLVIPRSSSKYGFLIGEALSRGSVLTPLEDYIEAMEQGFKEVRVYRPLSAIVAPDEAIWASHNWMNHIKGSGYNWLAFPRLLIKSMFMDWADSKYAILRKIGNSRAGVEWDNWCTEGDARAYSDYSPPRKDLWQTKNPTPMTTEQVAGDLPHKIGKKVTLENITDSIITIEEVG